MANALRGEIEIKVGAEAVLLRPTFEALLEVEARAGCTLFEIMEQIAKTRAPTLRQTMALLYGGAVGGSYSDPARRPTFEQFANSILAEGLQSFHAPALAFIAQVFSARGQKKTDAPNE